MLKRRSARKSLRQNIKRNLQNRSTKHAIRTQMRKVNDAVAANDLDTATQEFRLVCKRLDKAAARRVIHPNTASRRKSKLATTLASLATSGN